MMFHKVKNFCSGIFFFEDDKNVEERLILYFEFMKKISG